MFRKIRSVTTDSYNTAKNLNLNVKLYFGTTAIISLVQTPLFISMYFLVFAWGGNELDIGLIFGLASIVGVVGLIISGIVADRWRRDVFLWFGGIIYISSMIYLIFASRLADLYVVQIGASIAGSFFMPSGAAMVADSTSKGTRTKIYTLMAIIQQVFMAIGGVVGYFIYKNLGDTFEPEVIMPVVKICIAVIILASLLVFFINDKRLLHSSTRDDDVVSIEEKKRNELIIQNLRKCKTLKQKIVFYRTPLLIVAADFIIAFGAGISIPFLPSFFDQGYNKTMSELTLIFSLAPLLTAVFSAVALRLGKKIGRVKAIFWIELIAVILLLCFSFVPPLAIALGIFVLRQAMMNAGWPLINAIVMDLLPSNQRATFSAIDSLAFTAFNSLSQPIGGVIMTKNTFPQKFQYAFYTTSSIYLVGVLMFLFIKEGSFETSDVKTITQ